MHKVLVISYLFPPSGGVGVPRAIAYTRYLPRHGCRVSVLTARRPATAYRDPDLARLVPAETRIHRTFNPEPPHRWKESLWRRFSSRGTVPANGSASHRGSGLRSQVRKAIYSLVFPDIQSTWVHLSLRRARAIVRQEAIDCVVVIAPPYSLLNFAVELKRSFPKLKVITDLRDDWLGYYVDSSAGPSDYSVNWSAREWEKAKLLERTAFEVSDYVSIATPAWVEKLRARYPDIPANKFFCTTNGYEPQSFASVGQQRSSGELSIVYFGTLNTSSVYSPESFLKALETLPADIRDGFSFDVIGRVTPDCRQMLEDRANVKVHGFLPKQLGLERLGHADLLLLIATGADSHAGKLFDYLAAGKPILALSPPGGEIAKVLEETGAGWCVPPCSVAAIREFLLAFHHRNLSGTPAIHPERAAIERYSWPAIIAGFARATGLAPAEEAQAPLHAMAGAGSELGS